VVPVYKAGIERVMTHMEAAASTWVVTLSLPAL
jgi:hypothetical protein